MIKPLLFAILIAATASSVAADTYVVNYYEDVVDSNLGDGICDVDPDPTLRCSLRAAIQEAGAFPNSDRVEVPPPPPGEELSLNLLSAFGGGSLDLSTDIHVIGLGSEPVEILGGTEPDLPIFVFRSRTAVSVVENFLLQCRQGAGTQVGVGGADRGVLRDSIVTGCTTGIRSVAGSDWSMESVIVEGNDLGVAHADSRLLIRNSLISGNGIGVSDGAGAGISSSGNGGFPSLLTVDTSLITGNEAERGAGLLLENSTRVVVVNSTISGNKAILDGGGIQALSGAELELANSTVAFNEADADGNGTGDGGGVWFSSETEVTVRNSILSHNTAAGPFVSAWDCMSPTNAMTWAGYNLVHHTIACGGVTGDPTNLNFQSANLEPLADNGGPTQTHSPAAGSRAIDAGRPTGCTFDGDFDPVTPLVSLITDQRGETRHADGDNDGTVRCDIGAFELGGPPLFIDGFESGDTLAWTRVVP